MWISWRRIGAFRRIGCRFRRHSSKNSAKKNAPAPQVCAHPWAWWKMCRPSFHRAIFKNRKFNNKPAQKRQRIRFYLPELSIFMKMTKSSGRDLPQPYRIKAYWWWSRRRRSFLQFVTKWKACANNDPSSTTTRISVSGINTKSKLKIILKNRKFANTCRRMRLREQKWTVYKNTSRSVRPRTSKAI